jgi:hypothetical protein
VLTARKAPAEKKYEGFAPQLEFLTDEMNRDGLGPLKIAQVPSGYDIGRILTMSVTEVQSRSSWGSFHHPALERVAAIPGVQYVAFAWGAPLTGNNWPAIRLKRNSLDNRVDL